jgi:hypothetical protein
MTKTLSRAAFDRTHRTLHQARPTRIRANDEDGSTEVYVGGTHGRRFSNPWLHVALFLLPVLAFLMVRCALWGLWQ